jgi:hypothetical protein
MLNVTYLNRLFGTQYSLTNELNSHIKYHRLLHAPHTICMGRMQKPMIRAVSAYSLRGELVNRRAFRVIQAIIGKAYRGGIKVAWQYFHQSESCICGENLMDAFLAVEGIA